MLFAGEVHVGMVLHAWTNVSGTTTPRSTLPHKVAPVSGLSTRGARASRVQTAAEEGFAGVLQ